MSQDLSAVVLAGVHDWGACLLNQAVVRPLAPIANRPVIQYALRALQSVGVSRAVICANGSTQQMRRSLADMPVRGLDIRYRQDPMPRGPAGCIKDAAAELDPGWTEMIIVEASVIPFFDMHELVRAHRDTGASLTVATRQTSVAGEHTHEPIGVYVASPAALAHIGDKGFHDIKEGLVPQLHAAGLRVDVHPIDGIAPRLHGIASYFAINEWALKLMIKGAWDPDGYTLAGNALVHFDARIDPTVRLLGPVIVGPEAVLRDQAIIVGPTSIDRGCLIGQGAVVSRSAIWTGAVVGTRAHVDRCIAATNSRIESDATHFNAVCLPATTARRQATRPAPITSNDPAPVTSSSHPALAPRR